MLNPTVKHTIKPGPAVAAMPSISFKETLLSSKAALINLAESIKSENSNDLNIKLICPGFVETPATKVNTFKMPFLIIDLDDDYSYTVIGIPSRKHVWIMARDPIMNDDTYEGILNRLSDIGYNTSMIQRIVQDWD